MTLVTEPVLSEAQTRELLRGLADIGIRCWVVGGWGVDALLGKQTRDHHDLDLMVNATDLPALHVWLRREGFARGYEWEENSPVTIEGRTWDTAFVERHADGREIDVHATRGPRPRRPGKTSCSPASDANEVRTPARNEECDPVRNPVGLPPRLPCDGPERKVAPVSSNRDFSEYVAASWPRLVRSAVLLGCSESEAEDIVQAALERCLVHWRKVERADDRDAYVHRVLINTFTSARRRRWTTEEAVAAVPDRLRGDETGDVDTFDALMRCLGRLPIDQRTAIVLRYYAHLTEQQMAEVLGVAAGTVKSRLSRARDTLAGDPNLRELRGIR